MQYGEFTLRQMENIIDKLGGREGVKRLFAGELVTYHISRSWKTWKTIKLGTGLKTVEDFRKAIELEKMRSSDWVDDLFASRAKYPLTVSSEETEVDLVNVSILELGGLDGTWPSYIKICERAKKLGLDLCPIEVILQLRLQYTDQPKGEFLAVAIEEIVEGGGTYTFSVCHGDKGRGIQSSWGSANFSSQDRLVFVHRKYRK